MHVQCFRSYTEIEELSDEESLSESTQSFDTSSEVVGPLTSTPRTPHLDGIQSQRYLISQ